MDICEKKNQIQDLLNDIFSEYNRINESKIQSKCENDLEMRNMINTIRSLETSVIEKDSRIKLLEKTNYDYEKIIRDLQEKIELVKEEEQENNKFDMLRIQAKEITEKSREIERLNNLLKLSKSKDSTKIESILSKVENNTELKQTSPEIKEIVNSETGEENPNFIYEDSKLTLNDKELNDLPLAPEPEPSPGGSIHSDDGVEEEPKKEPAVEEPVEEPAVEEPAVEEPAVEEPVVEEPVEEEPKKEPAVEEPVVEEPKKESIEEPKKESKGKLIIITSKKIKYYAYENESPQIVYEFNGNKITDKPLGERMRLENGKHRVKLFSS
tara:strand:- start:213 stop:1190 length:978 start_codon:yes stop_codon:yes gene_type:complete